MTHAHARGLVLSRTLPTQQAGSWGAMPAPAYRDVVTALYSTAWSNIHTWPSLPLAGLRGWDNMWDNNVFDLWSDLQGDGERLVLWECFNVGRCHREESM